MQGRGEDVYSQAACGYPAADARVMCCEAKPSSGKTTAKAERVTKCVDAPNGKIVRHACSASPSAPEACSFDATNSCAVLVVHETVNIPSNAQPAFGVSIGLCTAAELRRHAAGGRSREPESRPSDLRRRRRRVRGRNGRGL